MSNREGTIDKSVRAATEEAGRLARQGAFDAAEAVCRNALEARPESPDLWQCLGAVRHHAGNSPGAAEAFENALQHAPENAGAWASYGLVLGLLERVGEAAEALSTAIRLDPGHPSAGKNLGLLLMKSGAPDQAVPVYEHLCRHQPQDADAWGWLGHAYAASDRMDEATAAYRKALDRRPEDGNLRLTLALAERDLGRIGESGRLLEACLAEAPDNPVVTFALAQNRLLTGDYRRGFAGYESRWRRPGMMLPDYGVPMWRGEDPSGCRILLHDEQGLGDTIQFCRFASVLAAAGAAVTLLVRPHLRRLLTSLDPAVTVVDTPPAARFDFHCPLMSLPLHLGLDRDTVGIDGPYLKPEPALRARWADELRTGRQGALAVGLIWQGDPQSQSEKGRSPPLAALEPLFDLPGTRFFLLQKHHGRDQIGALEGRSAIVDLGDRLDTGPDAFVDTAAVMAEMDAVVTSDTGPAHLAGALGMETFVLLKQVPEWRWGLTGERSPWYPSMRLFRQTGRGDWSGPVAGIRHALALMLKNRQPA